MTPSPSIRRHLIVWSIVAVGMAAGVVGAASANGSEPTVVRSGNITAVVSPFHAGPNGALVAELSLSTTGQASDALDTAIAAGGTDIAVFHERVSVGEVADLAGCGDDRPSAAVVDRWLHYGPLVIPGRTSGDTEPSTATLTLDADGVAPPSGSTVAVTLYFAHSGPARVDVRVG